MTMRKLLGILLLAVWMPAFAFNLSFLEYTPTYYFVKSDWTLMLATITKSLDHGKPGIKYRWKNPDSTAFGYVMPLATSKVGGNECRHATIFNSAKTVTGQATYRFCKIDGDWKVS
jgi:surface antigen